jgi:hypothetical protein
MLAEKEILSIVGSRKLIQPTAFAPSTSKQLLSKIKEIKRLGYAVSMRERDLDTGSIGAPVFTHQSVGRKHRGHRTGGSNERNGIQKMGKQVRTIAGELTGELASNTRDISDHQLACLTAHQPASLEPALRSEFGNRNARVNTGSLHCLAASTIRYGCKD